MSVLTPEVNKKERNLMLCNKTVTISPNDRNGCSTDKNYTLEKGKLYWVNIGGCGFETWYAFIYDNEIGGDLLAINPQWDSDYGFRRIEHFYPAFLNTADWLSKIGLILEEGKDFVLEEEILRNRSNRIVVDVPKLI